MGGADDVIICVSGVHTIPNTKTADPSGWSAQMHKTYAFSPKKKTVPCGRGLRFVAVSADVQAVRLYGPQHSASQISGTQTYEVS